MATTPVDDVSDDSVLECDVSSVSDEELIDGTNYDRVSRHVVTLLDVERPETDSFTRRRCASTDAKKPRKPHKSLAKCTAAAIVDGNRKSPVIKAPCQNVSVSTNRATSGVSSTYRRPTEVNESTTSGTSRKDRMLMRPWLVSMANRNMITHLSWNNEERTQIKINWKHASKSCWTLEDSQLFREWAKHTGKFKESKGDEPKRWKANFRCALNSLPDVVEVKNVGQTKGYKVYELLQQVNKKTSPRKSKRARRSKSDGVGKQRPLTATMNSQVSTNDHKTAAPSQSQSRFSAAQQNVTQRNVTFSATHQSPSQVIPTVVEEMSDMSQDEWTTTPSSDNETSEATDYLQFEYSRSNSASPSESSGYGTDSSGVLDGLDCTNIFPESSLDYFVVPSELATSSEMTGLHEFNMEDTHAYYQLQDPFGDVTF